MINALFLIRSLGIGGTERQLTELTKGLNLSIFNVTVVSFYDDGIFAAEIEARGAVVISLDKRERWDVLQFGFKLLNIIRKSKPDLLFSFLDVANLYALFVGKTLKTKVIWGIRTSYMDFRQYDWTARWIYRLTTLFSRFANLVITNSLEGKKHHISHGYSEDNMIVIPNGINTFQFQPVEDGRQRIRAEWGINDSATLIGLVGRLDKMKDHPTFLRAAAQVSSQRDDVLFVCVGGGSEAHASELLALSKSLGLDGHIIWAGDRRDMPTIYSALDVLVSSSYGEGFPNVIGEAMACGVPCVVTDVGDSAPIVGDTGWVVPPRSPGALAKAIADVLAMPPEERRALGLLARQRVQENYSVEKMVASTEAALLDLANNAA